MTSTHSRPATLLSLPGEVLTSVAMELSLPDILRTRMVCRTFHRACGTLQVWRQVFLKSLGVSIPKPFYLPKPLEKCSAHDLEWALRRWEGPWLPAVPVHAIRRDVLAEALNGHRYAAHRLRLAPGGRWALMCSHDGSVWYFDLSDDWSSNSHLEPRLLVAGVPPPASTSKWGATYVELAIDWASEEALGPSLETHFLTQFNLAILFCDASKEDLATREPIRVNIWRVEVQNGSRGPELRLGERLSSFAESPSFGFESACLYGTTLAYSIHRCAIFIVNWEKANGRTQDEPLSRRCIPNDSESIDSIYLLPGNRILVNYGETEFRLHNWETDYPLSKILLSEGMMRDQEGGEPIWQTTIQDLVSCVVEQPLIVGGAIRMVLPSYNTIHGLTIQLDDSTPGGVQLAVLAKPPGPFDQFTSYTQGFQLHRAVGVRGGQHKKMYFARYPWTGEHASSPPEFLSIDNPLTDQGASCPGVMLFDQFSNRIVATNFDVTQFFTIFASSFISGSAAGDRETDGWEDPVQGWFIKDSTSSDEDSAGESGDDGGSTDGSSDDPTGLFRRAGRRRRARDEVRHTSRGDGSGLESGDESTDERDAGVGSHGESAGEPLGKLEERESDNSSGEEQSDYEASGRDVGPEQGGHPQDESESGTGQGNVPGRDPSHASEEHSGDERSWGVSAFRGEGLEQAFERRGHDAETGERDPGQEEGCAKDGASESGAEVGGAALVDNLEGSGSGGNVEPAKEDPREDGAEKVAGGKDRTEERVVSTHGEVEAADPKGVAERGTLDSKRSGDRSPP